MNIKRLRQLAGILTESFELEEDVRQTTNALMTMMDEGIIDPRTIADACLVYMSEDDVRDMARLNELPTSEEDLYGDEDEDEDDMDLEPVEESYDDLFRVGDPIIDDQGRTGEIDGEVDEHGYVEVAFYNYPSERMPVDRLEYNDYADSEEEENDLRRGW